MTSKPAIPGIAIELDARQIAGVPTTDWDNVATWPDTSGFGVDGTGAGAKREFDLFGIDGTRPQVRMRGTGSTPNREDRFTFDGSVFVKANVTFFAVIHAISLTNHLPILGSNVGETFPRQWQLFVRSDGAIIFSRSSDPPDLISAAGVIEEGGLYVITARQAFANEDGHPAGMVVRVNGVEVDASVGATVGISSWSQPHLFVINDQSTGGIGFSYGRDKAAAWISGYSTAASDADVIDMEGFLAARFAVPGVLSPTALKPAIAGPEIEYDVNSLSALADGDVVATWDDQTINGNDALQVVSVPYGPEMDLGGWLKDGSPAMRMQLPNAQLNFADPGFGAEDELTIFYVFKIIDISAVNAISGGNSFTSLTQVECFVTPAGKITISFGTDEGVLAVSSADGEILEGVGYVISFTHSSTDGKVLRKKVVDVDGLQIGTNPASVGNLIFWGGANLGNIVNVVRPNFFKMMWFSGYTSLASVDQIIQMENFLAETFLGQLPIGQFPRDVLPEQVSALATPGAVKRRTIAGLVQIRSITAIGWSWKETFGLLRVTEPDHMELMAFVMQAWHAGQLFKIKHPLQPGSGIPPNGIGTPSIMVVGAGQIGPNVLTDGWPASTANCVVVGDVISIGGELAVYMVTKTADSNAAGEVDIEVNPPLRTSPANNALVLTTDVEFIGTIMGRSRFEPNDAPTSYSGYEIRVEEALL